MSTMLLAASSPLVGSFIAGATFRLCDGSPLWGQPCTCCGRLPGLVPVLSFLLRRGRCSGCGGRLSPVTPAVELAAMAVAALPLLLLDGWRAPAGCALGWALLLLASVVLRRGLLPDLLTLPLLAAGLALAASYQPDQMADRALAAATGWLGLSLLSAWCRRKWGKGLAAGDARLLAAAGAWVGPAALPWVMLAAVAGHAAADRRLPFGAFLAASLFGVWMCLS